MLTVISYVDWVRVDIVYHLLIVISYVDWLSFK